MESINNIAKAHGGVSVFGGVDERTHQGNDLYMEMKESGVINEQNLVESKVARVYGHMNEPPGAHMRVGLTALTLVEYFQDVNEQDVLLFIDNIFHFIEVGSEPRRRKELFDFGQIDSELHRALRTRKPNESMWDIEYRLAIGARQLYLRRIDSMRRHMR
ncbi:hypothetical protein LWI29_001135 [Acer saccharum]|uniref:H(+)-transporting two-sector ATPase n=1 Tax=Acer saccharum TaxID=4024 RepID=A0AA39ST21_ACESA|nr:hypothetical protein LWI29_001135 [Acer saccharum]